jgi:hypothetical protein
MFSLHDRDHAPDRAHDHDAVCDHERDHDHDNFHDLDNDHLFAILFAFNIIYFCSNIHTTPSD